MNEVATMSIVVAGAGTVGVQVATALIDAGNAVVLVDADPRSVAQLTDRGLTVVAGDGGVTTTLEEAGALRADELVACTGQDADNLVIALLARRHLEIPRVVARVNDERHRWLFDETWGVDAAISSAISLVHLIEEATGSARTVRLADLSSVGLVLVEATVTATSAALGQLVADLALGRDDLAAAVVRHGRSISTTAARQLRAGDRVPVVTPPDDEARVHHAFYPGDQGRDAGADAGAAAEG
ncbi:MAG: potassium channel family protein [Acidimicrobiales bacterium]